MKYRIFTLLGLIALGAGLVQAQDYDDIYYDASKSKNAKTVKAIKAETPAKTTAVYGDVPEKYKVAAQSNYRVERDEDEYNRRGGYDEPTFEVDINGDTIYFDGDSIYDEAFANTRRIERFYNPDIVILSDDEDLVELYYDESPTINLIIGSEWSYAPYGWGWSYPYYSRFYHTWFDPWYSDWYSPYYFGYYGWRWHGPMLWHWSSWRPWGYWGYYGGPHGWDTHWGWNNWHWGTSPARPGGYTADGNYGWRNRGGRVGTAGNRNGRTRSFNNPDGGRNGISPRSNDGNRGTRVGTSTAGRTGAATSRNGGYRTSGGATTRSGGVTTRSGGVTTRGTSGVTTRGTSSGVTTRQSSSGGTRSYSGGSSYGGNRSYSGSSSYGGSRSSGSSYGGSRSSSSSSSSYGGSRSSGSSGSFGGGSHSSGGGGGSHGGSSGGGGHRR